MAVIGTDGVLSAVLNIDQPDPLFPYQERKQMEYLRFAT
jgi:hypothetical protein